MTIMTIMTTKHENDTLNCRAEALCLQVHQRRFLSTISTFGLVLLLAIMSLINQARAEPMQILVYGDSLSAGYQLPAGSGFADQLMQKLSQEGLSVSIINASVSGDTTASGLARLDWSTPQGIDLVVLELGANDALQGLPVEQAKANLSSMIEAFKARGASVVLMGMRAPPNMGKDYVAQFDAIYPALAQAHDIPLYPFFLEDVAANPALNLADGIHPNAKGIDIIVSKVAPFVANIVKTLQ